jgi:hypothetical protein
LSETYKIDKSPKKSNKVKKEGESKTYKVTPVKYEMLSDGKIKCPIFFGLNLKVLDFGTIDTRPEFHSHSNIYPIGFKSIRTAQSIYTLGDRADFVNEIYEENGKPMFKTTCMEDPDNPIIKDNCSGIWCEIIKRVNEVTKARCGDKISISGP